MDRLVFMFKIYIRVFYDPASELVDIVLEPCL